jgi:hypothetical protein
MATSKMTNGFIFGSIKWIHLVAALTIAATVVIVALPATAQTKSTGSETKVETTTPVKAEPLSGAELWTLNCTRCHTARAPGEFTAAHWETVLRHMRVRANLPASQAKEILKFLQSGAGKQ